jgi:hypothetical protein
LAIHLTRVQTIFDSKTLPSAKRRQAWQDAICQIYLQVDCAAEQQNDYEGFVRELRFGAMTLTDTLSSPQSVLRQNRHIARLEKDCYFLGLAQSGCVNIRHAASSMTMHAGVGALYCASEPYALRCDIKLRSFWAELPRQAFASRFNDLLDSADTFSRSRSLTVSRRRRKASSFRPDARCSASTGRAGRRLPLSTLRSAH